MEENKLYLNWGDIDILVDELCHQIKMSKIEVKDIFGLQRGGLIPAVMVSHRMKIPITKGTITPTTLIIDDICDSGTTFQEYFTKHQVEYAFPFNLKTACLHFKPHTSNFIPTTWAKTIESDNWIVYPWEREDSKSIQDYKI
jgi:uncharacterized protein